MLKNIFVLPQMNRRRLCIVAMLVAVTAVLSIFCTFRIGNAVKIPIKFISVFLSAAFFGPWYGGLVGALGDVLNAVLVPVGVPLPQLTVLEFVSGFLFGVFFYAPTSRSYKMRAACCALLLFLSDMLLTTWVLTSVGYFPAFALAFYTRLPAGLIKLAIQWLVLLLFKAHLPFLRKNLLK